MRFALINFFVATFLVCFVGLLLDPERKIEPSVTSEVSAIDDEKPSANDTGAFENDSTHASFTYHNRLGINSRRFTENQSHSRYLFSLP